MIEPIAIGCAAAGAGLAVTAGARALSGGRRERHRRRTSPGMPPALSSISAALPMTAQARRQAERSLARSGLRVPPEALAGARLLSFAAGAAIGALAAAFAGGGLIAAAAVFMLGCAAGAVAPQAYLLSHRRRWRDDIERDLPNALDLLTICVQAGGTFEAGLRTVAFRMEGPLADAFGEVVKASAFMPTTAALKRFADNAQVRSLTVFAASLMQAEDAGIQLAGVLRSQAASVRAQRRIALEQKINLLPLKMTFPLVIILASLLLMLLAPMVTILLEGLSAL